MPSSRYYAEITGGEALRASLDSLDAATSGALLLAAVMRGAEITRVVAEELAPRVQPENVRSTTKPGLLAASIEKEALVSAPHLAEVGVGPTKDAFYGRFQELGTRNMSSQPFLRPAFDETAQSVVDQIGESLMAMIEMGISPNR